MTKQYKSSIAKNHKIKKKKNFDSVPITLSQMTNFRISLTESVQTTILNLTKMAESYPNW